MDPNNLKYRDKWIIALLNIGLGCVIAGVFLLALYPNLLWVALILLGGALAYYSMYVIKS
jgi:hypothetical protein